MTQVAGNIKQGSISAKQLAYIVDLCQRKGRLCPANIRRWSSAFASKYITFLLTLRDAESESPRYLSETDMLFNSTRKMQRGNYFWDDDDLEGAGPGTLPLNVALRNLREEQRALQQERDALGK